jgi:hypothetical protein
LSDSVPTIKEGYRNGQPSFILLPAVITAYAFASLFGAKNTGAKIAAINTATPNTTDMMI